MGFVMQAFNRVVDYIKEALNQVVGFLKDIWDGLNAGFNAVVSTVGSAFRGFASVFGFLVVAHRTATRSVPSKIDDAVTLAGDYGLKATKNVGV